MRDVEPERQLTDRRLEQRPVAAGTQAAVEVIATRKPDHERDERGRHHG